MLHYLLDRSFSAPTNTNSQSKTTTKTKTKTTTKTEDINDGRRERTLATTALINQVIDLLIEHNDRASSPAEQWRISQNLFAEQNVTRSKPRIKEVFDLRQSELEQHHLQHQISPLHNRTYHQHHQLTDFIDFSDRLENNCNSV